ncbi:MAG TPA: GerMN domain-containing protein [Gaiellaceae bacterium]|nr:GerMN domain-containing protein [Gaiellaceae bacterium]
MLRAVAAAGLAAVMVACGEGLQAAPPRARDAETARVTLYFLAEDGSVVMGVRRDVLERTPPPWGSVAGGALEALLAGPTAEEADAGFTTAIPRGTKLISLRSRGYGGTGLIADLSGLDRVHDALDRARIITQIVRTLVGISYGSVDRVWLREDGEPWGLFLMHGGVDSGPFDYSTLRGFHLGAACPGTETVECDHFDALP